MKQIRHEDQSSVTVDETAPSNARWGHLLSFSLFNGNSVEEFPLPHPLFPIVKHVIARRVAICQYHVRVILGDSVAIVAIDASAKRSSLTGLKVKDQGLCLRSLSIVSMQVCCVRINVAVHGG